MAKYFLGSVGDVEAYEVFESLSGEVSMDLLFTSKSLTDSAVNISINKEQIVDSYNGASAGVFYHSPNITITLSDIMWNPKFLEASLGQAFSEMFDEGNIEYYTLEIQADSNGVAIIPENKKKPVKIDLPWVNPVDGGTSRDPYVVIGKKVGSDEWNNYSYDPETRKIGYDSVLADQSLIKYVDDEIIAKTGVLKPNTKYCFRYPIKSVKSKQLQITTRIIPKELFLKITTPIFFASCKEDVGQVADGDISLPDEFSISSGKQAGFLVYEVPRWALDGDSSFNFAMSNTAGMQLTGTVLESIDNEDGSTFMRVKEVIEPRVWYEGLVDLAWDGSILNNTVTGVYGIYSDGSFSKINSSKNNICLVFKGTDLINAPGSTIYYGGESYNVTGEFTSLSTNNQIKIQPAVMWEDGDEQVFLILNSILLDIIIN